MAELEQEVLQLQLNPESGSFSIFPKDPGFPAILHAKMGVRFHLEGQPVQAVEFAWEDCQESEFSENNEHGKVNFIRCAIPSHSEGVSCEFTFGVAEEYPLALWKVRVINQGSSPLYMDRIDVLDTETDESQVCFAEAKTRADLGFYFNGWQSWSLTGWVAGNGRVPRTKLNGLQAPMVYNPGTPLPGKKGRFGSDFFAALGDRRSRKGAVLGFLSQKQHFGTITADFRGEPKLRMWANGDGARLDPGCAMETDWAVFNPILLDHREPLEKYFEAVARENHIRVPSDAPVGWCSWYHFYTNLSADDIRSNLKSIIDRQETLPIQLVQIDDGFETQVGDWFTFKPSFPDGVKPLAGEITREGLIPGLWLAPFTAHPGSEIFKGHPDWILRKKDGKPVNAGFGWGALFTGLDLTVPEALDYACSVVRTASQDWGYPYLKLDFLYCAALDGVYHDPTKTRAQVMRLGMEAIREAVGPDVTLLGCGAPFGPMLGLVDAMRIGPDVSGDWTPHFNSIGVFFKNEPSMPSARNSIRDILTRANLHGHWWINDPDCLLIRPDTRLSLAEVQSLATAIGLTGGSLLLSDDLPKLPADRVRIAEVLLPVIGERARVLDWFDAEMPARLRLDLVNDTGEWHLLAKFNWSDRTANLVLDPCDYDLEEGGYWVSDFWNGRVTRLASGEKYSVDNVPPHGCVLAAFRKIRKDQPLYLGSDLHFSMGQEAVEWEATGKRVSFTLRLPRRAEGNAWLYIPWQKFTLEIDGQAIDNPKHKGSLLEIPVSMDGFAKVVIHKQ